MNRDVRRKLEMAVRVREFSRAHPSADANYGAVLGRLEDRIARMEALARQQQGGYLARRAASSRRATLRRRIQRDMLRHLVTVAELAARDNPTLAGRYRQPSTNGPHEAFRTLARKMLEQGRADRDLLAQYGLAERLLDDLAAALDEFDASVAESGRARQEHVGARAELEAVGDEIMRIVDLLDGLNRYRFGGDAEKRAAWESARELVSGPRSAPAGEAPGTTTAPATAPASPATGEIKPAA
ncbi:MAG TPA: hypothetical protein VNI83_02050 [Vicinamibacterales bacterium]|nr:hypothetical protein [Vicinamibacterales bacterium]